MPRVILRALGGHVAATIQGTAWQGWRWLTVALALPCDHHGAASLPIDGRWIVVIAARQILPTTGTRV